MDKIVEYINNQTNNKFQDLLFFGAIYNKSTSTMQLEFDLPTKEQKSKENLDEIEVLCKQYFGNLVQNLIVKFKNQNITMSKFKNIVLDKLSSYFHFGKSTLENIVFDFDSEIVKVIIFIYDNGLDENYADTIDIIKSEIFELTNQKIDIVINIKETQNEDILELRKSQIIEDNFIFEEINKSKNVNLSNIDVLYGKFDANSGYLAGTNLNGIADSNVVIVGNVKSCNIREIKSKKDGDDTKKKYMTIELEFEGEITRCVWFFTKDMKDEPQEFAMDTTLAVLGKINDFNGQKSIRISSIASCSFVPPKKVWRKCPETYRYIRPEPYEFTEQTGFFFEDKITDKKYLLENTFVVYDLETTGISPETCKIIDIGAFKIVNGKIVEKFCTFVNPECEIPPEASKINRITNQMVENSPTIEMALPDFYKFCQGSIVLGYNNIGFDDLFIAKESKKQFYNFDNPRDDVFNIAKKNIFGLRNYKLSTVCQAMNVPLIDAHRASNDALATAKLFIKLVEKYYK